MHGFTAANADGSQLDGAGAPVLLEDDRRPDPDAAHAWQGLADRVERRLAEL
ncbi:hypothetical protein ACFQZ8_10020 [Micromonospora azadirachtae]|uniref:Uncharacterized protein n=1 Tax=Micromonospora azadirachtae TaxID=1970735 RepID=A0ABW3A0B0_9ACTN